MIKILENMVLQYENKQEKKIRIIWISPEKKYAYYVQLEGTTSMPRLIKISDIQQELADESIIIVPDPYAIQIDEESIKSTHKRVRDEHWKIVSEIWADDFKEILDKSKRKDIFKRIAQENDISEKTAKRILSRFWQRGMTKNALLPDYKNSGGKGKIKKASEAKRGRPRQTVNYPRAKGINVDETIKDIFEKSIKTFYYNKKKKSLKEAYTLMLKKYFSDVKIIEGEKKYKVWDQDRIPTYTQFYYWFNKLNDFKQEITSRISEVKYELNYRELISNSTIDVFGPGAKYQIDATIGDVFLVSEVNRNKVIGRPIIYFVMDVYSRLITGIYIGLEGPSWLGAMMALDNVVEDKVEFCKKYNVDISKDEWPDSYLPETIIADRGEFEGYNVENLINNLNINIENTPPYRGDLKGIVERKFRTINTKIKHTTPGAIQKQYRERGDKPYWLDAKLNIKEFTAIIIHLVIHHNTSIISKYPNDRKLIESGIKPIPTQIWKWGLENRRCGFVKRDKDIIRLNLMPKGKASLSRHGIRFKKAYYSSEEAIKEQWFINPQRRSINIVYDPRDMNHIYIPKEGGTSFLKCFMVEKSEKYKGLYYEDIVFMNELETEQIAENKQIQTQKDIDSEYEIEKIIRNAEKKADKDKYEMSDNKRTSNIRENRKNEKEKNRKKELFELDKKENINETCLVKPFKSKKIDDQGYKPKSKLELLRKTRDEERDKKSE